MSDQEILDKARETCGFWDDTTDECSEDYSDECPFSTECKKDAEETE